MMTIFFTLSNEFALETNEEQLSFPPLSVQVWHAQVTLLESSWSSVLHWSSSGWLVPFLYPPKWAQLHGPKDIPNSLQHIGDQKLCKSMV